jgi:hypothetical protein
MDMKINSLVAMLHTNQLPYKRLHAGDFIYELAPKQLGFNHKIAVPDSLRDLLGENISIVVTPTSDVNSFWHSLLYAIMPEKYTGYNWHYRKIMVEQVITALDERIGRAFKALSPLGLTLKPEHILFATKVPTPELLFYVSLILNINIVVYLTGMVNRTEYYYPTLSYDQTLPLILLHADDKRTYSVIAVNEQTVFSYDLFASKQVADQAPKQHPVLVKYIGVRCSPDAYAKINGLNREASYKYRKTLELMKLKIADLKELSSRLDIRLTGKLTKQDLTEKIVEFIWRSEN